MDLGHHLPNTNIEMVVSRLIDKNKLGGFHFNDSKFGDDDLDSGSINPYELFLIFNELTSASIKGKLNNIAYMIDQSHNITDPIESLILSANEILFNYVKSQDKSRESLRFHDWKNNSIFRLDNLTKAKSNLRRKKK